VSEQTSTVNGSMTVPVVDHARGDATYFVVDVYRAGEAHPDDEQWGGGGASLGLPPADRRRAGRQRTLAGGPVVIAA
jgi:hypothetical protein